MIGQLRYLLRSECFAVLSAAIGKAPKESWLLDVVSTALGSLVWTRGLEIGSERVFRGDFDDRASRGFAPYADSDSDPLAKTLLQDGSNGDLDSTRAASLLAVFSLRPLDI